MHGLNLAVVMLVPIPWTLRIVFFGGLVLSLFYYLRRYALLNMDKSIIEIELRADCTCAVRNRRGEWRDGNLLPATFIARYMVILNIAPHDSGREIAVVIFADAIHPEQFRELRVILKWKCGKALNRV